MVPVCFHNIGDAIGASIVILRHLSAGKLQIANTEGGNQKNVYFRLKSR